MHLVFDSNAALALARIVTAVERLTRHELTAGGGGGEGRDSGKRRIVVGDAADAAADIAHRVEGVTRHDRRHARSLPVTQHPLQHRLVQRRNLVAVVEYRHMSPLLTVLARRSAGIGRRVGNRPVVELLQRGHSALLFGHEVP